MSVTRMMRDGLMFSLNGLNDLIDLNDLGDLNDLRDLNGFGDQIQKRNNRSFGHPCATCM